ncbi:DUF5719 family protein [Streptomyces sp. NPDC052396]|uniref:DUF5719 family protein n=1 Tax=Streptomyces sp. NPDC052396 TaxID=3365689 RepID=UPI0037CCE765
MKRTTLSLFAAAAALAAVAGTATLDAPSGKRVTASHTAPGRLPVQQSALLCPAPSASDVADTTYTSFTPAGQSTKKGSATLVPAAGAKKAGSGGKPVLAPQQPGRTYTAGTDSADAPALIGTADGALAPGWTVQQTTVISAGIGRGLHGLTCTAPGTSFWFPGAGIAKGRQDYVHLVNPDNAPAVVDLELYGKDGQLKAPSGEGITVPPRATVPVLLSALADGPADSLTVHAVARSGRVAAALQTADEKSGGDWLPPTADAARRLVLPGIPADATAVRLVVFAPGSEDSDIKLRLAGAGGSITPAGHESLHIKSGMTTVAELGGLTKGEAGSLLLSADDAGGPVVAALRVTRGKDDKQETAWIPATAPIEIRGTVADNRPKGTTLSLTAPGEAAEVKVTATGEGGAAAKSYTVKAGATLAVEPPQPAGGKGPYALTVEKVSGGPLYAARTLALPKDGIPMFTIQPVPDDRSTVAVPAASPDLSVLGR